jgi:hypothetical protein
LPCRPPPPRITVCDRCLGRLAEEVADEVIVVFEKVVFLAAGAIDDRHHPAGEVVNSFARVVAVAEALGARGPM